MNTFTFKTNIIFGSESLSYLKRYQGRRVLVVADPFLVQSGMITNITHHLSDEHTRLYTDVAPDPTMELITRGVRCVEEFCPEVILAVGGGSAIDEAKAMMYFAGHIQQTPEKITFIAIPTTSGTGSEVTAFSVVTDEKKGIKHPLVSEEMIPDEAILDTGLVASVPPAVVADTGMDVLTHAIEAYVSTQANDFTDALAEKAAALAFAYLPLSYASSQKKEEPNACENVSFLERKEKMHHASCLAGMAFQQTSLGICHAIAHNLGGTFHIPHGRANAILLPHVIEYNAQLGGYSQKDYTPAARRYAALAHACDIQGTTPRIIIKNLIHEIYRKMRECNMPTRLRDCGIEERALKEALPTLAQGALNDACLRTNPRKATEADIIKLIEKAY